MSTERGSAGTGSFDECMARALEAVRESWEEIVRFRDLLLERESCDGKAAMQVLDSAC